jgi:hypothetical protein
MGRLLTAWIADNNTMVLVDLDYNWVETALGCSTKGATANASACCSGPPAPPPGPPPPP